MASEARNARRRSGEELARKIARREANEGQPDRYDRHGAKLQPGSHLWAGHPPGPEGDAIRAKIGRKESETKRRQRTFRESVKAIMKLYTPDPEKRAELEAAGVDPTVLNAINLAVSGRASAGDVEAARYLRDTAGERPRDGLEIGALDDRPLAAVDVSRLTDDQLRALVAQRSAGDPAEG